jgi:putative transposase
MRIYPTSQQRRLFKQWFGIQRKFYNETVAYHNDSAPDKERLNWMRLSTRLTHQFTEDYVKRVPYQIKSHAVKESYTAFFANIKKTKKLGTPFTLRYKTRKSPTQSCYIPKTAVKASGIYYTLAGKLKYAERIAFNDENSNIKDCRLLLENNRWFLLIPTEVRRPQATENQGRIVAIDPGIRSFCTYFSTTGSYGHLGYHDFHKIYRILYALDCLISKRDCCKKAEDKQLKISLNRAIKNLRFRFNNLIDEVHNKVIAFMVNNYDTIIYPKFRTSEMAVKSARKLRAKSVRMMLGWKFYKFEQKLKNKCNELGKQYVSISEAFTSKTNSFNGDIMNIGSKEAFYFEGIKVNRDINGARGILLRALRDSSAHIGDFVGCLVAN